MSVALIFYNVMFTSTFENMLWRSNILLGLDDQTLLVYLLQWSNAAINNRIVEFQIRISYCYPACRCMGCVSSSCEIMSRVMTSGECSLYQHQSIDALLFRRFHAWQYQSSWFCSVDRTEARLYVSLDRHCQYSCYHVYLSLCFLLYYKRGKLRGVAVLDILVVNLLKQNIWQQ